MSKKFLSVSAEQAQELKTAAASAAASVPQPVTRREGDVTSEQFLTAEEAVHHPRLQPNVSMAPQPISAALPTTSTALLLLQSVSGGRLQTDDKSSAPPSGRSCCR